MQENGLLVITNEEENGIHNSHDEDPLNDTNHVDYKRKLSNRILISSQSAELLQTLGEGSLGAFAETRSYGKPAIRDGRFCILDSFPHLTDSILKKYAQDRKELLDEMAKLKFELEEERMKTSGNGFGMMNGSDNEFDESSMCANIRVYLT